MLCNLVLKFIFIFIFILEANRRKPSLTEELKRTKNELKLDSIRFSTAKYFHSY